MDKCYKTWNILWIKFQEKLDYVRKLSIFLTDVSRFTVYWWKWICMQKIVEHLFRGSLHCSKGALLPCTILWHDTSMRRDCKAFSRQTRSKVCIEFSRLGHSFPQNFSTTFAICWTIAALGVLERLKRCLQAETIQENERPRSDQHSSHNNTFILFHFPSAFVFMKLSFLRLFPKFWRFAVQTLHFPTFYNLSNLAKAFV